MSHYWTSLLVLKEFERDFDSFNYFFDIMQTTKLILLSILIVFSILGTVSVESIWEDIQESVTNIAASLGVQRAGDKCINFLGDINRCEDVPILECDKYIGITNLIEAGTCRVKWWLAIFVVAFFILIAFGILSSACICVCKCH